MSAQPMDYCASLNAWNSAPANILYGTAGHACFMCFMPV